MTARHTFTCDAARFPLHAVEPEEQDSPWLIEPETPSDMLDDFVNSIWGPGGAYSQRSERTPS